MKATLRGRELKIIHSVQVENPVDRFDLRGLYQPRVSDGH